MFDDEPRGWNRILGKGLALRRPVRPRRASIDETVVASGPAPAVPAPRIKMATAALAFRGYDVANLGRSRELLEHAVYGPVVQSTLDQVSAICAQAMHAPVDLAARIRTQRPTSLDEFPHDIAMIVGMELAQLALLERYFEIPVREAKLSFGYSIGELSALVVGGVFPLDQLLPVPLGLATDCAQLAADATMGVLFTRGATLMEDDVEGLCQRVRGEGHGLIGPSAFLAPNATLLMGQKSTLNQFEQAMRGVLPEKVMLRRNPSRWPPLHSPLVWEKYIPNRTAMAVHQIAGGTSPPTPNIISCVTGKASYDAHNSRDHLIQWTDHPQRLWDAIDGSLAAGVETIIHVGPAPNLIPSTFARLSNNVNKHLGHGYLHSLGRNMVSTMNRYAWLAQVMPARAALLRAPFLEHVILEDWLLAQQVV